MNADEKSTAIKTGWKVIRMFRDGTGLSCMVNSLPDCRTYDKGCITRPYLGSGPLAVFRTLECAMFFRLLFQENSDLAIVLCIYKETTPLTHAKHVNLPVHHWDKKAPPLLYRPYAMGLHVKRTVPTGTALAEWVSCVS